MHTEEADLHGSDPRSSVASACLRVLFASPSRRYRYAFIVAPAIFELLGRCLMSG